MKFNRALSLLLAAVAVNGFTITSPTARRDTFLSTPQEVRSHAVSPLQMSEDNGETFEFQAGKRIFSA